MKWKRLTVAVLLTLAASAIPVSARTAGTISVEYQVDPYYEVVIPSEADVSFMVEKTAYGTIAVQEAVLEDDKCILVEMNASGFLENEEDPQARIPYQILDENEPFTSQTYTKEGEGTKLDIFIKNEDWEKAKGGKYTTEVTFTISYVDKR